MAQITITIPDEQVQRVRDGLTTALNLDQPATLDDAKAYLIAKLKQVVKNGERDIAERAIVITDVDAT